MLRATIAALICASFQSAAQTSAVPRTWIDRDTGHRVIRLTDEPGSASLYFNQNGYTADGRKLIYTTPNEGHTHHASPDEPQFEIKSDKTDHIAMHKGTALRRLMAHDR